MKARTSIMMMLSGIGIGAASATYLMANKNVKNKACKVMNDALDQVENKMTQMNNKQGQNKNKKSN